MLVRNALLVAAFALFAATPAQSQFLLVPDAAGDRLMAFNAENGSVVDPNFVVLGGTAMPPVVTPVDVLQVGFELWITDSGSSSIYRYDSSGTQFLGTVGDGHSALSGIAWANGHIWVTSGNPAIGLREYDESGVLLSTVVTGIGAIDVLDFGGELLVSAGSAARIDRYSYAGRLLGVFAQLGSLEPITFAGTLSATPSGHVLVGGGVRIVELDADGTELVVHNPGPFEQAAFELPGGQLFYTAASEVGIHTPPIIPSDVLIPSPVFPGPIQPRAIGTFDGAGAFALYYCEATASSTGVPAEILASGSFSVAANETGLIVLAAPASTPGIFFYGAHRANLPLGNGVLCINPFSPGLQRASSFLTTNAFGDQSFLLDLSTQSGPGAITAGTTWNFQFWYRDPAAGGAGFNLSSAVSIPFGL